MFYVNNKQVLGMFLNGKNYNYLAYGFSKIIPENRNAQFAYINLAGRNLSQYRVEYGNIQSGYSNFPIARLDYSISGLFHSPLTYYYGGNIVPTKNVPVCINNGYSAIRGTVYNDININGNIVHFASNSDFKGHNVNIQPASVPIFNGTVMNNCSNFHLRSMSAFSKSSQPTLYNCNNFSGWFNSFGDDGTRYLGFRGFLHECRDGVFNFNLMGMRGGGSDANVKNYYNFSCISNCNNIRLNINGSPWQAWVHPNCYSSNCNITTRYIIPGFDRMNHCNFNIYLPSNANVEQSAGYSLLSNSRNCNYNLNALDSNLHYYRSATFFDNLNNCNLNLLVNNVVSFSYTFGSNFNSCNIVFDNIKGDLSTFDGWSHLNNCRITGNVNSKSSTQGFLERCDGLNVNLNFAASSCILLASRCNNIKGNIVAGNMTYVNSSSYMNLNVNNGNVMFNDIDYGSFNVYNAIIQFRNVNNSNARSKSRAYISAIDNCHNLFLYDLNIVGGTLIENVCDSYLAFNAGPAGRMFSTARVNNCSITGFPKPFTYTSNCRFDVGLEEAMARNSSYITWNNVWPHGFRMYSGYRYCAGLKSIDGSISRCSMASGEMVFGGSKIYVNVNNMQTSIDTYYNGTVTANLPNYNMNIKLNVDCNTLNLGIFQAGPPHGFQNATISANDIYAKGSMPSAYVQANCDTKLYCENYCNVCFRPYVSNVNSVLQPVILINNYDHYNTGIQYFSGGLTRIGNLSTRTGPRDLSLSAGTCVFINNAVFGNVIVNNSLLFLGNNCDWTGTVNVTNGGRIVTISDWDSKALSFVERKSLAWNIWDSGPWGSQSLINFCLNV